MRISIDKRIEKQLNLIVDRYLELKVPFKDIKKYLTGKNISTVIDELYELELIYLNTNKDKNSKDFKLLINKKINNILKDREFAYMDMVNENKYIKEYIDFDDFDYEEDFPEKEWKLITFEPISGNFFEQIYIKTNVIEYFNKSLSYIKMELYNNFTHKCDISSFRELTDEEKEGVYNNEYSILVYGDPYNDKSKITRFIDIYYKDLDEYVKSKI